MPEITIDRLLYSFVVSLSTLLAAETYTHILVAVTVEVCVFICCAEITRRRVVESRAANVSLDVRRQRPEFGSGRVFCSAQSVNNGASQNQDFIFKSQVGHRVDSDLQFAFNSDSVLSLLVLETGSPSTHTHSVLTAIFFQVNLG